VFAYFFSRVIPGIRERPASGAAGHEDKMPNGNQATPADQAFRPMADGGCSW
jgi:hypothetical protein